MARAREAGDRLCKKRSIARFAGSIKIADQLPRADALGYLLTPASRAKIWQHKSGTLPTVAREDDLSGLRLFDPVDPAFRQLVTPA